MFKSIVWFIAGGAFFFLGLIIPEGVVPFVDIVLVYLAGISGGLGLVPMLPGIQSGKMWQLVEGVGLFGLAFLSIPFTATFLLLLSGVHVGAFLLKFLPGGR